MKCCNLFILLAVLAQPTAWADGSALNPRSAWDGQGPEPAYVTQKWPQGRVLTWANPGTSGELSDPANWLEEGKPTQKAPDHETDIILPAADTLYTVKGRNDKIRHVDVFKNADLHGTHRNEIEIWGNCWIHDGGYAIFIAIRGDQDAFLKNENAEFPTLANGLNYRGPKSKGGKLNATQISHKLQVCKYGTASVEFIGKFGVGDEIQLQHGRLILNGELRWSGYTGKGALEIYDGGILELQSGSKVMPFYPTNKKAIYNIDVYRNGMIQGGSPERPLTADATIHLGFGENDVPGRTGLYAAKGSMVKVYSADPAKHKLTFSSTADFPDLMTAALRPVPPALPKAIGNQGTQVQLAGELHLDGVHFDYLSEGGLAIAKDIDPSAWKNVTYGERNAGPSDKLLSEMKVDQDIYYHARGDGASEFALVTTAISGMKSYFKDTDAFQLATLPAATTTPRSEVENEKERLDRPVAIVFKNSVSVTVDCKVPGARMRYTLDGTEPTKGSPVYNGPIALSKTSKLMVKAYKSGLGFSPTYSAVYVVE